MNILNLNTFDILGGAARAAYRIHTALRENNIHSEMLVARKIGHDVNVNEYPIRFQQKKLKYAFKILSLQKSQNPTYHTCNLFPSGIHKIINQSDADIVHFHWIGNEFISIGEVKKIRKPIVWTLPDMWAFSGAEHYDDLSNPGRYKQPYNESNRSNTHAGRIDIDAWVWRRKHRNWHNVDITFVTPSKWLAKCLSESALFFGAKASVIPYCLDVDVFQPTEKNESRAIFELPRDKKLILFGADHGSANPLKGYKLLEKALWTLASESPELPFECVVFGDEIRKKDSINGIGVIGIGRISDDKKLAMLYSAADVYVTPSMIEAFGQTVSEAMSCATPCVGFNIGGIPDMIDHHENGYLAESYDTGDLAQGIRWVLEDKQRMLQLGNHARRKVLANFTFSAVGKQYEKLYERILS